MEHKNYKHEDNAELLCL